MRVVQRATVIELETERLLLRQLGWGDLDELARICGDARVMRHMGPRGEPMSRGEVEAALRSIIAHWGRHGFGRWAAVPKGGRGLIGYCGLRAFAGNAELVYLLDHPYWGRGLATEMARACLRFGFGERAFDYITALTKPANLASRRVLEKVGMRYRRTVKFSELLAEMDLTYPGGGELEDIDVAQYSISRGEYRRRTAEPPQGQ